MGNGKIPDVWEVIEIEKIEKKISINCRVKGVKTIVAPLALTIEQNLPNDKYHALLTAVYEKRQRQKTQFKARKSLQWDKYLTTIRRIQDRLYSVYCFRIILFLSLAVF